MCVSRASGGGFASACSIFLASVVRGSRATADPLNVTTPSGTWPLRWLANARAAAIAAAIGPCVMLRLASITSTTPKRRWRFALELVTVRPGTGFPFSVTVTEPGGSDALVGRLRTKDL